MGRTGGDSGLERPIKKPDFVIFPNAASRQTAVSQQNTSEYARNALTVVEVKQWDVNLSKKTGRKPIFDDQNPMYQIDTYLNLTGLEWGVLSNGRLWRLLHHKSSRTLETYFEIDLLAALTHPDETMTSAIPVPTSSSTRSSTTCTVSPLPRSPLSKAPNRRGDAIGYGDSSNRRRCPRLHRPSTIGNNQNPTDGDVPDCIARAQSATATTTPDGHGVCFAQSGWKF